MAAPLGSKGWERMKALRFFLQRIFYRVIVLVGLSIIIFVIARIVPGDPARMALGPRAPEEVVQRLRVEMNLDKPIFAQYVAWVKGALHGDFGKSLVTRRPVSQDIAEFFPATVELVVFAGIVMGVLGIALGVISARYSNRWVDNLVRLLSYLGIVTPSFVFAILFILLFGYVFPILPTIGRFSNSGLNPITGFVIIDYLLQGNMIGFWDGIRHLILPGVALAVGGLAQEARITRSSMTDNLNKEYIALARSQGVSEGKVFLKYLLKPSLIPTVSVLGLDFASLFANAFLIEVIFNWPGISRYCMNAMLSKDLNAISAVILLLGLVFIIVNMITDAIVSMLDPRIRLGEGRSTV